MRRIALVTVYGSIGIAQNFNSVKFSVEQHLQERIGYSRSVGMVVEVMGSIVSGILWPVSIPVMIFLETKWKKERT